MKGSESLIKAGQDLAAAVDGAAKAVAGLGAVFRRLPTAESIAERNRRRRRRARSKAAKASRRRNR